MNSYTAAPDTTRHDLGLLLIRVLPGVAFTYHGAQKLFGVFDGPGIGGFAAALESMGFPFPTLNAVLAGSAEFFGGIVLILGLGLATRAAAAFLAFTMFIAAFVAIGFTFDSLKGGNEYPLTLLFIMLGLTLTGPGRFDALRLLRPRPAVAAASPAIA